MPTRYNVYYLHRRFPLKVTILYMLFTFITSVIGPVEYLNNNYKYWLVIPFMICVILCLCFGYYLGGRTKDALPIKQYQESLEHRNKKLLRFSLTFAFISILMELVYVISIDHFSIKFSSLGMLYSTGIEDNSNFIILFRFLSAPFRMISLSLGLFYFNRLSKNAKFIAITNVILYLLVFLFGYGNQKGVSDIAIYLAVAIYINRIMRGKRTSKKAIIWILAGAFAVLMLFSYMQYLRYAPRGINASNYHLFSTGDFRYNTNHIIFKVFGDKIGFGMAGIINGYMSQGYYGLSLCLQIPFKWTYGIGSSYAVISLLRKFGIAGIYEMTYLGRMQEEYVRNGLSSWNTIFPWLASDFTWIGAILFFVIVGYMMAKSWKELILFDNIISYLLFICLVILVVFIPANNQLFHGYDSFIVTWVIILLWLFRRRKYSREQ